MSHYRRKPGKWAVLVYDSYFDKTPVVESRHMTEVDATSEMDWRDSAPIHRWRSVHRLDRVRTVYGRIVVLGAERANGLRESDVFG